jgi:hypothetical protein
MVVGIYPQLLICAQNLGIGVGLGAYPQIGDKVRITLT